MLRAWPLLFFIVPLVEIYFLIQIGEQIGAWKTVLLVIITAIIGVTLLREQGMRTLLKANQAMQVGQMPAQEMFDGFILAAVGILLLTPGFFTDALGFTLLVPSIRKVLMRTLLKNMLSSGSMHFSSTHTSTHDSTSYTQTKDTIDNKDNRTIDGDFKRED